MAKTNRTYALLLSIVAFSFISRIVLLLLKGYPPGADIGLHNSLIYSITGRGNVDFLYNFYHIGGGVSLTFPGYHIFTACIIMFTGLPEYIAHAAVVSFFSALIVVGAFLITKKVFSLSAAYVVAFLAAISRFDFEMLTWAGYPNVITLMLIPLTYYLYLEKERFSKTPFFVSTSLLVGAIFLTHSLSSVMFIGMFAPVILFVFLWPKTMGESRKSVRYWIFPIIFGAILVSPFLVNAAYTYWVGYSSETASSQILPYWIVIPLFGITAGFFAFSTKYYKKFLALPTFLLAMWAFVPLICTQGYLLGLPVDYNRFLYFLILPVLVFIGVLIEHGAKTFASAIEKKWGSINLWNYRLEMPEKLAGVQRRIENASKKLSGAATPKMFYSLFILVCLLFAFVVLPIFISPLSLNCGETLQSYYQTMTNAKWEAMQWLKQNTEEGSVLVADALFGWWLGGFAQRPTLSAVNPQYLTVSREFDNATFARYLLDTNYVIGNGYAQIREDGGYIGRHNPMFLINITKENYLYPFFNFDNDDTQVTLVVTLPDGSVRTEYYSISSLAVLDMHKESTATAETISVTHGNDRFNFTQTTTLPLDVRFARITQKITTDNPAVTLVSIEFGLHTKGEPKVGANHVYVAFIDQSMKSIGHIMFPDRQSRPSSIKTDASPVELVYALDGKRSAEFSYFMGVYQYTDEDIRKINKGELSFEQIIESKDPNETVEDARFWVFDYREELINHKVSYVVLAIDDNDIPEKTEIEVNDKFRYDPLFSLVFINEEVAIYKVNG